MTDNTPLNADSISDNRFNRFDEELIDRYFNQEGKTAILNWHNKQVEEAMAKFHLKKGVKYDVKASDSVIVITHTNKLKDRDDDQL